MPKLTLSAVAVAASLAACSSSNSTAGGDGGGGSSTGSSSGSGTSSSSSSGLSSGGVSSTGGSTSSGGASNSSSSSGGGSCTNSDGGAPVTGLCGSSTLGSLSNAQVTQLCTDTMAYFGTVFDLTHWCKWEGMKHAENTSPMSDSDVQTACTSQMTSCEQSDAGGPGGIASYVEWELGMSSLGSNIGSCFMGSLDSSCTATVAQYAACVSDMSQALLNVVNEFPACSQLTLMGDASVSAINTAEGMLSANPPASCTKLTNVCASLTPPDPSSL